MCQVCQGTNYFRVVAFQKYLAKLEPVLRLQKRQRLEIVVIDL